MDSMLYMVHIAALELFVLTVVYAELGYSQDMQFDRSVMMASCLFRLEPIVAIFGICKQYPRSMSLNW